MVADEAVLNKVNKIYRSEFINRKEEKKFTNNCEYDTSEKYNDAS
jgi:hypothetical protein